MLPDNALLTIGGRRVLARWYWRQQASLGKRPRNEDARQPLGELPTEPLPVVTRAA